MKRVVTLFSLIIVVLFSSVTLITLLNKSSDSIINEYNTVSSTQQKSFQLNASPLHFSGIESLIVSSNTTFNSSLRQHVNPLHTLKLRSVASLIHLRYISHIKLCMHRAAFIQRNGYYLYYLQKILI